MSIVSVSGVSRMFTVSLSVIQCLSVLSMCQRRFVHHQCVTVTTVRQPVSPDLQTV